MESSWIDILIDRAKSKIDSITEIWTSIGIEGPLLEARRETLSAHLLSMLDAMYDEELVAKRSISNSIKSLKVQIEELELELGFSPQRLSESSSLVLTEKHLHDRFKILEEKAAVITKTYEALRREEESLAARLDESTTVIVFAHAPNRDQLRALKLNIDNLTLEKRARLLKLSELRRDILSADSAASLSHLSKYDLISRLKADDALEVVSLSKSFLKELEDLRNHCEAILQELRLQCDAVSADVAKLANRLNLEHSEFLDLDQPTSSHFLTQLRAEFERLTELRRQNLSVFIRNCRAELQELWDICLLGADDRDALLVLDNGVYTEAVLERLEAEIARLRDYYDIHRDLFETLDSWQTALLNFREAELKKKDPAVLKNRGGILLTVEKQYKQSQRDLKRCDTLIQQLTDDPLHKNISIHGMSVTAYLDSVRLQHEHCKENKRNQPKGPQSKRNGNTPRTPLTKRPGNKAIHNDSKLSNALSNPKKPRLDASGAVPTGTPSHRFLIPGAGASRSARKPGGMTSTPRNSREFLL